MQLFTPLSDPLSFTSNFTNANGSSQTTSQSTFDPLHPIDSAISTVTNSAVSSIASAIFTSRWVSIILGLLLIAGAVILFATDEIFDALKGGDVAGAAKAAGRAAIDVART